MHGFDINRENPRRLGCIHNIENTMVMCHLSDPSNINQISRQIGSVCRHDGLCLWTDCLLDLFITDPALVITLYKSHFHSFFLKIIDRPEDRIMLQYSRNYMISRIYQSPDCRIQAFGRIGCKRDLLRILRTKELCQALSCFINDPRRPQRCCIGTSPCISKGTHCIYNRIDHFLRLMHRSRRIIKINHSLSLPLPLVYLFYQIQSNLKTL